MSEKVTVGLEKVFFQHILENPDQIIKVEPYFFKNDDIQFIYNVVREEYILSKNKNVPQPQQILAMVKINDVDKKIADNLVKSLLKGDNSSYEEEWVSTKFKAWKLTNLTKNNVMKSVEYIRGLEEINYDNVVDVASKIRNMFNESSIIDNDDEDLGEDFDDPESHKVTDTSRKINTGWGCIDKILSGGWDQASLNCIMAETNGGKCFFDSYIEIKNKKTGYVEKIKIEDFYNRIKIINKI